MKLPQSKSNLNTRMKGILKTQLDFEWGKKQYTKSIAGNTLMKSLRQSLKKVTYLLLYIFLL